MIMCVLLCYPVSFHMLQLLLTGRPISSFGLVKQNGRHITCLMSNRVIPLKRPYISPYIAPRGSECENNL